MQEGSKKAIVAAFIANLGIAIAKLVGFFFTRSAGLLAEAGHSLADTSNQALLLLGGRRAAREANEDHPFGFGRERYFWAFVVALVLFSMGGLFALYEGIQKLIHPHETENLAIAIGILVMAIGLETLSLRTAVREANHVKPKEMGWWEFVRTSKSPELPVVLLEDIGAEIGLFLALAGVGLAAITHDPRWDAIGSIAIGILLIVIGIVLAVETKGLLVGERATPSSEEAIRAAITNHPTVRSLIHLRTQHIGPDVVLVGAKIEFVNEFDTARLAEAVDAVEKSIRAAEPTARWVYLEPDLLRSAGGT
ncbi:MAG: cation diffusion facilitator family transporter [Actinobacteria bacterium]|nr:cation diffusion facilitator family transporter [Actinomycetota bacterium]